MAAARASVAVATLSLLGGANAVVYNYVNGGNNWNAPGAATPTQSGWTGTPLCGTSTSQSPINIADVIVQYDSTMAPLQISYGETESWTMEVTANYLEAADLETSTTGAGNTANTFTDGITVDGTFLPLNQFHFHSPSEHTINGMHYPLEMHMVHKLFQASASNSTIVPANTAGAVLAKAAVIGVMFAYSPTDTDNFFISKLMPAFELMRSYGADSSDSVELSENAQEDAMFNLTSDVFGSIGTSNYYRYTGSLTTPGCNEGILWHVMAQPVYLSTSQLVQFTSVVAAEQGGNSRGANNRLIQPLNGRTVRASFQDPNPLIVSGSLQFQTGLNAASFSAQEATLIAALAAHLNLPTGALDITGYDDVPSTSRRRSLLQANTDVAVGYSVTAPSSAAAQQVSNVVTSSTVVAQGQTEAPMSAVLRSAGVPVTGVSPADAPTLASATCADSAAFSVRGAAAVVAALATAVVALAF